MELAEFFEQNPRVALGFSGGVDSAYLFYAAKACGTQVRPYFIKTAFQPQFELDDALRLGKQLGVEVTVLTADILSNCEVAANPANRCYFCKRALFGLLRQTALQDGYEVLLDGTNASDQVADRPGMEALQELSVRSPLRECGLTKDEIRRRSKEAGLFTWDKPAYACLATRIPTGEKITTGVLERVEGAEAALFALDYTNLRVRVFHNAARVQLPQSQLERAAREADTIKQALQPYFSEVFLDLAGR